MIVIRRTLHGFLEAVHDIPGVGTFPKDLAVRKEDEAAMIERQRKWAMNCGFKFEDQSKAKPNGLLGGN